MNFFGRLAEDVLEGAAIATEAAIIGAEEQAILGAEMNMMNQ